MNRKKLVAGILFLILSCVLIHAFAYRMDNIRMLYKWLELCGLYNGYLFSSYRNRFIWLCIVVAIIILIIFSYRMICESLMEHISLKYIKLVFIVIIGISLGTCWFFPRIHRFYLSFQKGINGVIMVNRKSMIGLTVAADNRKIEPEEMIVYIRLQNYATDDVWFHINFIDLKTRQHYTVFLKENGDAMISMNGQEHLFNLGKRFESGYIYFFDKLKYGEIYYRERYCSLPLLLFSPKYRELNDEDKRPYLKVVIYNDTGSKSFYYYRP